MEFQFTGWVCTDCMLAENGYDEHEMGRPFEIEPWELLEQGTIVTMGLLWEEHDECCPNRAFQSWVAECDCERREFSHSWCDGCGSQLAGERHAYTFWYQSDLVSQPDSPLNPCK